MPAYFPEFSHRASAITKVARRAPLARSTRNAAIAYEVTVNGANLIGMPSVLASRTAVDKPVVYAPHMLAYVDW